MLSCLLYFVVIIQGFEVQSFQVDEESLLYNNLFANYNKFVRPEELVTVQFSLVLYQIIDVDERQQIFKATIWAGQFWIDPRLQWNPSQYNGTSKVVIPTEWIWRPDIVLYNSVSDNYQIPMTEKTAVNSDGSILFYPVALVEIPCTLDIVYFPFDKQTCTFEFGPWSSPKDHMSLQPMIRDMYGELFTPSTEWTLRNSSLYVELDMNGDYEKIFCTVVIQRKPLFYIINMVLPCLFFSLLKFLVFLLPVDTGEKMSFGMSLLIAMSVFNLLVTDTLPPSANGVPLIARYLLFDTILVALSITITVYTLRIHHTGRHQEINSFVKKLFFKILPKVMCMKNRVVTRQKGKPKTIQDDYFKYENASNAEGVRACISSVSETINHIENHGDRATPEATSELLHLMRYLVAHFQSQKRCILSETIEHEIEQKLQDTLFYNYSKYVRPADLVEVLTLDFKLWITLLLDVDEKRQIITSSGWTEQSWKDKRLQWNSSEVDLQRTIVPTEWIWTPSIILANSANKDYNIPPPERVALYSTGVINYPPTMVFETPCTLDIRHFPFDIQRCEIIFESWQYTTDELIIRLSSNSVRLEGMIPNTEWDIINTTAEAQENAYFVFDTSWSRVIFTLVLARRPVYYIINIVAPVVLLALLTMLSFCLPCDSGEKISFNVSILIALSVFHLLVGGIMPNSDSVPLIVRYLLFNTFLIAISTAVNVLVLRLHHRPPHDIAMSRFTRKVFLKVLPKLMCLRPFTEREIKTATYDDKTENKNMANSSKTGKTASAFEDRESHIPLIDGVESVKIVGDCQDEQLILIRRLAQEVRFLNNETRSQIKDDMMAERWKYVAVVVDRLVFWISFISFLVGTFAVFTDQGP
ncbi:neuronal acetylcholine receptor subunit alpha-2-like [Glandiceps talaboti]